MNIPLDVDVHCTDGRYGRSTYIVLNPERIVPVSWIKETTPELILLNRPKDAVTGLEQFNQTDFVQREVPHYATDPKLTLLWPYRVPTKKIISDEYQKISPDELAVRRGTRVKAIDGRIGQVDEFLIDPESGYITHLVLREGLPWDKKHIAIPVSDIDRIEENTVHLKIDKQNVKALPTIALRKR
jgi:sporulation protein YlmC with PRC-barrel domain